MARLLLSKVAIGHEAGYKAQWQSHSSDTNPHPTGPDTQPTGDPPMFTKGQTVTPSGAGRTATWPKRPGTVLKVTKTAVFVTLR